MTVKSNTIVSIVLPTYNRTLLLEKALNSVLQQSFENWELLIIHNNATDLTEYLVKELAIKDNRIKYFKVERSSKGGISKYLNYGIRKASGKYIARLDDDDTWPDKDKLKKQVEFLESNPQYVICGGGVIMVDSEGKEMYRFFKNETDEKIRMKALLACPFEHTTIMFSKEAALSAGGYRNYRVCEDWDFFLRLGLAGKFYNHKEYFTNYLQSGENMSLNDQSLVAKTEMKIIWEFRKAYPNFTLGFTIHSIQYIYSFFPDLLKRRFQYILRYLKRRFL